MTLCCGVGVVTIEGTPDDWRSIKQRVAVLSEWGLSFWTDILDPVIDQFISASEGNPDLDFWSRMYLQQGVGSGSQYNVTGWVNALYLYTRGHAGLEINPCLDWQKLPQESNMHWRSKGEGTDPDNFPSGMVSLPVTVNDHGISKKCLVYGGLVGVQMDEDYTVSPCPGYAVCDVTAT